MSGHGRVPTGQVSETGGLEFPGSSWLSREAAHRHCGAPTASSRIPGQLVGLGHDVIQRPCLRSRAASAA
jgi:hypothetical protein